MSGLYKLRFLVFSGHWRQEGSQVVEEVNEKHVSACRIASGISDDIKVVLYCLPEGPPSLRRNIPPRHPNSNEQFPNLEVLLRLRNSDC